MADIKELDSIIQIDNTDYEVVAAKLAKKLTISVQLGDAEATQIAEFNGSENKTATIAIPTYTLTKSDSTITLTGSDGSFTSITDSTGDMTKSTYDTNNNGKVDNADFAENAAKLGNRAASEYALKSDIPEGADLSAYMKKSSITVSQEEPTGGETGDIWFKY